MPSLVKRQSTVILETPFGEKPTSPEFEPVEDVFFDLYGRINSIQNFIDFDNL